MNNNGCVFIVCGGFNLPDILWSNDETGLVYSSLSSVNIYCTPIPECLAFHNFFQLNEIGIIYDTLFKFRFSNERIVVVKRSDVPVVSVDFYHSNLVLEVVDSPIFPISDASYYFLDFVKVKDFLLSYHWREIISASNTNEVSLALSDTLNSLNYCVSNFVPLVKYKKATFPPWFSNELNRLVIRKKKSTLFIDLL